MGTCEAVVIFNRPWTGTGVKRLVGGDDIEVGVALGHFLVRLYATTGRMLEVSLRHSDGSTSFVTGREWEHDTGVRREVLS